MLRSIIGVLILISAFSLLKADENLSQGMFVAAQFSNGNWYTGKITRIDGGKYTITFTDGDVSVVTRDKVRVFSKDIKLTAGERVLAVYGSGQLYVGTVKSVEADKALIKWEDGSGYTSLKFDKILKNIGAHADKVTGSPAVTIRRGGSIVGSIDPDGTVRLNGSITGKFEANGDVRKNGSVIGSISSNGDIRKNGSIVGNVSGDGTVRRNGLIIGSVSDDGTVRKNGAIIGSGSGEAKARTAAYFFFFFLGE